MYNVAAFVVVTLLFDADNVGLVKLDATKLPAVPKVLVALSVNSTGIVDTRTPDNDGVPEKSEPIFKFLATFIFLPTPNPPDNTTDPLDVLLDSVVSDTVAIPPTYSLLVMATPPAVVKEPPTVELEASVVLEIDKPPSKTTDAVVELVLAVVLVVYNFGLTVKRPELSNNKLLPL
jgi:hypothetical protein